MIKKNVEIELLAPAKDKNTAIAAINAGADAVYIGFSKFGARKSAGNSVEDIADVVNYANIYRVNVYVTLNTIYTDDELPQVIETIYKLYDIGVSAIIIQDMGILNSKLPPIRIFASTQCHNNTLEKVKFFEKIGIERVILPREFSIFDIENITTQTDIDVETFIHGALCVSYSGQCYLSCYNGLRSANRGDCAQPCRRRYSLKSKDGKLIAKNKYLLSMKDLNLSNYIKQLIEAGVTSFKIEGRLKDEAYVRNVVSFYRQKIDSVLSELKLNKSSVGISYPDFVPDLSKSFNRGFTDFFADGKRKNFCSFDYVKSIGEIIGNVKTIGKNYFTLDKNSLHNGDGICFLDYSGELNGTKILKVENNKIFPQSMQFIKLNLKIYRNFDNNFNKKIMSKNIERKIPLTANINFDENKISLELFDDENNSAFEYIEGVFDYPEKIEQAIEILKENISKTGGTEFEIKNINFDYEKILFVPPSVLNKLRRAALESLRNIRQKNHVKKIRDVNISYCEYPQKILDYKANVCNKQAENFYKKCGVSIAENAAELSSSFFNKDLMISKHCIKYTLNLCKKYNKYAKVYKEPFILIDEKNTEYILNFDCKNCVMHVKSPLSCN